MREYIEVRTVQTEYSRELTKVVCNKCGNSAKRSHDDGYDNEFVSFDTSFGYGSSYDGERWSFDLCEKCLTDLVRTFMIVPDGFGEDSYFARYPQVMFEKWKETGEVDLEAGMTDEEIAENGGSIYEDGGDGGDE